MIVINFKNYKKGKDVLKLAKSIQSYLPKACVAVPIPYVSEIAKETKLRVFSQHVDSFEGERNTGYVLAESLKAIGVYGVILNHAEHQLPFDVLKKTIYSCQKNNLKTLVCVPDLSIAKKVKMLKPWAIAYEDPALIGTGKSIATYRSDSVREFADALKGSGVIAICGAGISSREDIIAASKLGCSVGFIASAVANAKNPSEILKTLRGLD